MRVPLSWLREYVDLPSEIDIADLTQRLDMSGTKVEEVHGLSPEVEGIVVAEVLTISSHPNADTLSLVEVETGDGDSQTVVCGAKNFSVGDRVPLARVGARLPGMEITERKIRGQVSRGMLCSASELGISKDHAGILVLQPDSPLGEDVASHLGLGEPVIELEITPNRPDCMSLIGVAREIGALYGVSLRTPQAPMIEGDGRNPVTVDIHDPDGCPRYLARYLSGVTVGPSPTWIASRLLAAGFRPISNVVDVTNYVLLECGQPLHAFDAAKVQDSTIVVRRAGAGETMTTLDEEERKLDPEDLLIADPSGPLAIAGVMGGLDSEVSDETSEVIIESAAFDRVAISFTSRRLGLRSEASARFERGSDPEMVPYAAARAAALMTELSGASSVGGEVDAYPQPYERPTIRLRPERTRSILGIDIPDERQIGHLASIGLEPQRDGGAIVVEGPSFRRDLRIEADLVEEVARLEGFEHLRSTLPQGMSGGLTKTQTADRTARRALVAAGMTEAWTSSFSSPEQLDALGYPEEHPGRRMVELANPMLDHEPALRTTLLPGLLRSVALNLSSHRPPGVALFEVARIYQPGGEDGLAEEAEAIAAVATGLRRPDSWRGPKDPWDFFSLKGTFVSMVGALGVAEPTFASIGHMPYHPTRAAALLLDGEPVGTLGELHPDVCDRWDVPEGTVAFEVSLDALVAAIPSTRSTGDLPRFPSAFIDLAFVLDRRVPAGPVGDVISAAGGDGVVSVRLFDVYEGPQVPEGKKSLAFALELRDPERTLGDEDVSAVQDRIVGAVAERFGGELRT